MEYNPAFSSPLRMRQVPPLPENHHNLKILCLQGSHCVQRYNSHQSSLSAATQQHSPIKQSALSNLANSARACCLPQRGPLHIPGNLSQTCPQYQTEPSNCQLHLARGYITSRGPHVHDFPALSSEHLQLHQQNATQAQCQDGRHPTKKTSYCL